MAAFSEWGSWRILYTCRIHRGLIGHIDLIHQQAHRIGVNLTVLIRVASGNHRSIIIDERSGSGIDLVGVDGGPCSIQCYLLITWHWIQGLDDASLCWNRCTQAPEPHESADTLQGDDLSPKEVKVLVCCLTVDIVKE